MPTFFKFLFSALLLTGCSVGVYFLVWSFFHGQFGLGVVCAALVALFGYMTFQAVNSYFFKR